MSNRTAKGTKSIHGTDPQLLIEKITRERIYSSLYWKEECFGLDAQSIVDKAVDLDAVGGTFANQTPTPFLCLLLKLLQIGPTPDIVEEYIRQVHFKYLSILGLLYFRFTNGSLQIYQKLEPFLADHRRIRVRKNDGSYSLGWFDEIVDGFLSNSKFMDIVLPRISKRYVFEDSGELTIRTPLVDLDEDGEEDDENSQESDDDKVEEDPLIAMANSKDKLADTDNTPTRYRESMSIEETNAARAKLGLKPLSN